MEMKFSKEDSIKFIEEYYKKYLFLTSGKSNEGTENNK